MIHFAQGVNSNNNFYFITVGFKANIAYGAVGRLKTEGNDNSEMIYCALIHISN